MSLLPNSNFPKKVECDISTGIGKALWGAHWRSVKF